MIAAPAWPGLSREEVDAMAVDATEMLDMGAGMDAERLRAWCGWIEDTIADALVELIERENQ